MDARSWKRMLLRGGLVIAMCLTSTWIVARALPTLSPLQVKAQLQTQREVTVEALKAAIAAGDDGIGPLPLTYLDDDEETQNDDPLVRALW